MILTGFVIGGYNIVGLLKNKAVYIADGAEAYCSVPLFVYGHIAFYRGR